MALTVRELRQALFHVEDQEQPVVLSVDDRMGGADIVIVDKTGGRVVLGSEISGVAS